MAFAAHITRTLPVYPNGVFLQWALDEAVESGAYVATVSRSGGPQGPWLQLATDLVETYAYIDTFPTLGSDVSQLSLSQAIFYKVSVTAPSGAVTEATSAVEPTLNGRQKLLKRKLLRDEYVLLSKFNGVPVAVLKRKHWGTRCPKCYDKASRETIRAGCTTCYGTSYVGGYFDPMITLAKRATTPNQVGMTAEGKAEIATTRITMLDMPALQDDDILVFLRDNRRFIVKRVVPTELQTVTVHQVAEVSELNRGQIVYRVKVDPTFNPPLL